MEQQAPEFESFAPIPRLKRVCFISEKIDGTNAQVYVPESDQEPLWAGSRTKWITPSDDNKGFARWVVEHADELRTGLGPGRHFGEWWGAGIGRRYGLKEKRFSLFNTGRWGDDGVRDMVKWPAHRPACCHVVPLLYHGPFSMEAVEHQLELLHRNGSSAAPGFVDPEGVVVYLPAADKLFKVTLGGDGHKSAVVPE